MKITFTTLATPRNLLSSFLELEIYSGESHQAGWAIKILGDEFGIMRAYTQQGALDWRRDFHEPKSFIRMRRELRSGLILSLKKENR